MVYSVLLNLFQFLEYSSSNIAVSFLLVFHCNFVVSFLSYTQILVENREFFVHSYEPVDSETVRILPRRLVQESYNNGDKIDVKIFS